MSNTLELTPAGYACVPENVKTFFPNPIDGYLYLIVSEHGQQQVWKCIYADEHPWKERKDHHSFVENVSESVAQNMLQAVHAWNKQGEANEAKNKKQKEDRQVLIGEWLDKLPNKIRCFNRQGEELVDAYGNTIACLTGTLFVLKPVEQIEEQLNNIDDFCE